MAVALNWMGWMWFGDADRLFGLRDGWRSMCCVLIGFMFGWRDA